MPLVINIYFYHMLNRSLLVEETIHISHIYWSFYFYSLNPCFLANFKLITSSIALLFNNTSTVTPSCLSILSKPIFTVTSFNMSLLSRLQHNLLSISLESITNLLLLEPSQRLPDSLFHLNYYCLYSLHIPTFFSCQVSKFPTTVTVSTTVYLHHIWIMFWHEPCPLLLWIYNDHIHSLNSFHWNRPCWHLLLDLLP